MRHRLRMQKFADKNSVESEGESTKYDATPQDEASRDVSASAGNADNASETLSGGNAESKPNKTTVAALPTTGDNLLFLAFAIACMASLLATVVITSRSRHKKPNIIRIGNSNSKRN